MKIIMETPEIEMPNRVQGWRLMRGRPIAGEEFRRMLARIPEARKHHCEAWRRYPIGL